MVGRWALLEELGSGSMGVVYRAHDPATGERVALKQLRVSASTSLHATLAALFQREFHTLARLKHPRIIDVYEYGQSEHDGHYYTMELLDGADLRELAPLPPFEACRHMRDIASSLALLHAHRLVHRDVAPTNVRLSRDGRAKLIDFGALATFGPARDVIGTAPSVAPEVLSWMPLDHRADLFALGALFYWTLTGRHAYPARKLEELPAFWERQVAPPSSLAGGVRGELDELVMSLLSLNPLARPASAALVIDRINAITGMAPEDERYAAQSYLLSSPMVGREPELRQLAAQAQRARDGAGACALIEGAAGSGKTRLLHEFCLAAQIMGLLAVRADAQTTSGSFGVIEALIDGLLRLAPEDTLQAAQPHAALLAHLSAPLAQRAGVREPAKLPEDLGERRAHLQTALHAWLLALARRRPLLLAIDNLHAADDNSAACIAALAREAERHGLLLLSSLRADRQPQALAIDAVIQKSTRMKLGGLDRAASEELLQGLFGPVNNTGRLAAWLFEHSAGNPHHAMRLVHELVSKGIAKYVDGTWVLPLDIAAHELPSRLDELLGARLAQLSAAARELVQALAVHGKPLRIERCIPLLRGASPREVHGALDELVAQEFIVCESGEFHFVQDAARETLLAGIEEARRSAMHRQVAEVLLATAGSDVHVQFEAGWHLLHGGERARGAQLLAEGARRLVTDADVVESDPRLLVRALLAALEVHEEQRRSEYQIAPLLLALMPLSFYVDWRLATRYGERALEIGFRVSGLSLAHKLRRFLGRKLGLIVGLSIAAMRFRRQQREGLAFTLREAIVGTISAVPSVAGFFSVCLDRDGGERVLRLVEPLTLFGTDHVAGAIHAAAHARLSLSSGREREAAQLLERNCERAADPGFGRDLTEARRRGMQGGELLPLGVLQTYRGSSRALEIADQLAQLGHRLWAMAADQLRMMHFISRGEEERAAEFLERTELHVLQGGTTWQTDVFLPAHRFMIAMLTDDALALRQASEQLARQAREIPSLRVYAEAAHAGYLAARGDGREALAQLETVVARLPARERIGWAVVRLLLAQLLNRGGDHARAKETVLEVTSHLEPGDYAFVFPYLDSQRHLALAELGLGNFAEATRILDGLLAEPRAPDHPLWLGLLHKARAQVALREGDAAAFRRHLAQLEHWFRSTKNPALIGQWERLAAAGAALGFCERRAGSGSDHPRLPNLASGSELSRLLAQGSEEERLRQALGVLVAGSGARAGYMYRLQDGALALLAARPDGQAPSAVCEALRELLEEARLKLQRTSLRPGPRPASVPSENEVRTETSFEQTIKERQAGGHRLLVLATAAGASGEVVGGVALELGAGTRTRFTTEHLAALAAVVRGGTRTGRTSELPRTGAR